MEIGDRIRRARRSAGLSQRDLAAKVGVTHGLVGQWESHRKKPGRDNLRKIAEVTMVDADSLLSDTLESMAAVRVTNPVHLALLRRFDRMSARQQQNLLELMGIAADLSREFQKNGHPMESQ